MPLRTGKPRLGSEIVELSGESKYPTDSIYYALREYVANSIDAIHAFERFNETEGLQLPVDRTINIIFEVDTLHIFDQGIGINEERLLKFTDLCSSDKDPQYDVGRFGFGSHSGGAIADKAIIWGKTYGSEDVFVGSIDFDMIRKNKLNKGKKDFISDAEQLLSQAITEESAEHKRPKDTHFAHLALKLRDDFQKAWNEEDARLFLGQYCPVDFDPDWKNNNGVLWGDMINQELSSFDTIESVKIFLNGKPVYKPYNHKFLKNIEVETLHADGDNPEKLLARCWYAQTTGKEMIGKSGQTGALGRKLSLYLNGMMIDTIRRDYLESVCAVGKGDNLRHYVGEIHIVDSKGVIPHDVRTSVIGGEGWDDLKEQISRLLKKLIKRRTDTSKVQTAMERLDEACELIIEVPSQTIQNLSTQKLDCLQEKCDKIYETFDQDFGREELTQSGQERKKRKNFNDYPTKKRRYERMFSKLEKDRQAIKQLKEAPESLKQSPIEGRPQSNVEQKSGPDSQKTTQSTSELNFNIPARDVVVLVERIMVEVGIPEATAQQAIARLKQELPSKKLF